MFTVEKTNIFLKWLDKLKDRRARAIILTHIDYMEEGKLKMKENVTVSRWDTAELLNNQEDIVAYLQVAFESGDTRQITKALGNVAKAKGMMDISRETGLTREHLYTSLSENGNPTLQTLTSIVNTLGCRLSIMPVQEKRLAEL